jgi:hypothetical protein
MLVKDINDGPAACAGLDDFIAHVNAQTQPPVNKKLTVAQAAQLIAGANHLEAVIGCP